MDRTIRAEEEVMDRMIRGEQEVMDRMVRVEDSEGWGDRHGCGEDSDDLFSDVEKEKDGKTRMSNSPMSGEILKHIDMSGSTGLSVV